MKCKCGYENADGALVCGMCGEPLNKQSKTSSETGARKWGSSEHTEVVRKNPAQIPEKQSRGSGTKILLLTLVVLIVIIVVAIVMTVPGGGNEAGTESASQTSESDSEVIADELKPLLQKYIENPEIQGAIKGYAAARNEMISLYSSGAWGEGLEGRRKFDQWVKENQRITRWIELEKMKVGNPVLQKEHDILAGCCKHFVKLFLLTRVDPGATESSSIIAQDTKFKGFCERLNNMCEKRGIEFDLEYTINRP